MFYVVDVANVTTDYKRLFLRILWRNAQAASPAVTLLDALLNGASSSFDTTSTGLNITQTAGNGHSVSFQVPTGAGSITPQDIADLYGELLRRYDEAVAHLGGTPTDSEIFTEMNRCMVAVFETTYDFSNVGVPQFPQTAEDET